MARKTREEIDATEAEGTTAEAGADEDEDEAQVELTPEGLEVSTFTINSDKVATHPKAYNGRTFRFRRMGPVTGWEDVTRQAQLLFESPEALRRAINGQGLDLTNQKRIKDEGNAETPTGADELQESLMSWKVPVPSRGKGGTPKRQREANAAKVVSAAMENPELAELLRQKAQELGITL